MTINSITKIIPEALRYGIDIRDVRHYTVNDLLLMIRARAEQEQQQAWQVGARVLEAIGVAFGSKHKKYSDLPKILENNESEEQKELNGLMEYLSRFNKH